MNAKDVIRSVKRGKPESGWLVFRFRLGYALFQFVVQSFFCGLPGLSAYVLWRNYQLTADQESLYIAGGLALVALVMFFFWQQTVRNILAARSNMIVLTEKSIIKSLRGGVSEIPYETIADFKLTRLIRFSILPQLELEYTTKTGAIYLLAHSNDYQNVETLARELEAKPKQVS